MIGRLRLTDQQARRFVAHARAVLGIQAGSELDAAPWGKSFSSRVGGAGMRELGKDSYIMAPPPVRRGHGAK